MNIQNLLKKIQQRRDQRKENNTTISTERLPKTLYDQTDHNYISIGTVNQMPNTQNDRSYFKQYFESFATEESKQEVSLPQIQSNTNKLQRIESELDSIEKMKSLYQNKKKQEANGSIEKHCNRSIEKHALKPSLLPKFKPTSEFVVSHDYNKDQSISYTFKDESFNNNNSNKTEIISFKGAQIFDDSQQDSRRTIQLPRQQLWGQSKEQKVKVIQQCVCQQSLKDFMQDVNHKMSLLALKIAQLEQSNSSIKIKHQRVASSNLKAISILSKLEEERQQLLQTQQKWTSSKGELQAMLKQVKYKHQKSSKQNMSKQDCENYFKNKDKAKSPLKVSNQVEQKKTGKNKVQCLLQRLQLRVQK